MSNYSFISRIEIDARALRHNMGKLRQIVGKTLIAGAVKANAYGHGLSEVSSIMRDTCDWFSVNALFEAEKLRALGVKKPIYIMGYVLREDLPRVVACDARLVIYDLATVKALSNAAVKLRKTAYVHIKVETGNNRQGVTLNELVSFAKAAQKLPGIIIEGIGTHFANIEDINPGDALKFLSAKESTHALSMTSFPAQQLARFQEAKVLLDAAKIHIPLMHCANSAATILFPQTHFSLVRPGIALYGLWPSKDTEYFAKKIHPDFTLKPVLSWRTRIAQIKEIPKDQFIGYGCTYRTKKKSRIAILPMGYYDGFDRGLSNKGSVLIHGKRAPVVGRVCMNMTMVDITRIPAARVEDLVTLIGSDGKQTITAEEMAESCGTINYEITTRINENIPRVITNR